MKLTVQSRKPTARRRFAAATLVSLLALLLLAAGCSDEKKADPNEVLTQAVPAMKALESFAFTYDVERPENADPAQGLDVVALEGAVDSEGNMKAGIDLSQSGIPLHVNFVAVGDTHYVQNPLTGNWQSVAASASPVGSLNLGAGAIQILEKIQEPTYEGSEQIQGVECDRVKGTVAAKDVEGIAQAISVDRNFPVEVWVGVDDHLVRRITLEGAATSKEPDETVRKIELQNFNEPVLIEPPA